jgi:hypothetical protein
MKWRTEMDGQGAYWWKADTPLGPVYAEFRERSEKFAFGWRAFWLPDDSDIETPISGGWSSADVAKDEAERWIRARARALAKKLARFAK